MVSFFNATIGKICRKDVRNFLCGQVLKIAFRFVHGTLFLHLSLYILDIRFKFFLIVEFNALTELFTVKIGQK